MFLCSGFMINTKNKLLKHWMNEQMIEQGINRPEKWLNDKIIKIIFSNDKLAK